MNLKRFEKKSTYNCEMQNKADNYAHLNKNYCKRGQVVLAGDSITDFYNNYELFYEYTKKSGKAVYNRGISGDTSNRLIERLESNVLCLEPEKVVYLIGTNDHAKGADDEYIISNIRKIIEMTRNACPGCSIAVESIYPVIDHKQRKNKNLKPINEKLKKLCSEEDVAYIDLFDALCDENGSFDKAYTYDGLHPNVHGYEVVTKALLEFI